MLAAETDPRRTHELLSTEIREALTEFSDGNALTTDEIYALAAAEGARPDPLLTISEWADAYRTLSQRASAEAGVAHRSHAIPPRDHGLPLAFIAR